MEDRIIHVYYKYPILFPIISLFILIQIILPADGIFSPRTVLFVISGKSNHPSFLGYNMFE